MAYGHENISLEIVEYCKRSNIIETEQFYIDYFKPEYNILTKARSSLDFKHSEQTLSKFKLGNLSHEALHNLKMARAGATLARTNLILARSHVITVKNVETNNAYEYSSIRAAAREFQVSHPTLLNYVDKDKLFKGRYIIIRKKRS